GGLLCVKRAPATRRMIAAAKGAPHARVASFAAAEARGGGATTSDADEVEAAVDQFVADLVAMLPVTTTTSTSTTSSSSPPSTINCGSGGGRPAAGAGGSN